MEAGGKNRWVRRGMLLLALTLLLGLVVQVGLAQDSGPAAAADATLTIGKTTNPAGGQGFWVTALSFQRSWGRSGSGAGNYRQPRDVEVDSAGNFYISDHRNSRITKLNSNGEFVVQIGVRGRRNGQLLRPNAIAVSGNRLYVTDTDNNRIAVFTTNGAFVRNFGSPGTGNGQFNLPNGVAVDAAGNVYVADTWNHRIQVFDADGTYLRQWGTNGTGNGQLNYPAHLDIDAAGNVYVVDSNNHRIQVYSNSGAYVRQFGGAGTAGGRFNLPVGIDVADGFVYVSEVGSHRIQKLTPTGAFVAQWNQVANGQTISRPNGLFVQDGWVYASDIDANRIQIYRQATVTLNHGQQQALTLPAGTYDVTEAPKAGWTFGSAVCNGGSPSSIASGARVSLANGASVMCGFVNNQ